MTKRVILGLATAGLALLHTGMALAQDGQLIQVGAAQKEFPESITSTSDGTLFAGSLTQGTVFKAAPGAKTAEAFIPAPTSGPTASFGVYADEAQGTLWVCYGDMSNFSGAAGMPSVLTGYDIASGAAKSSVTFPATSLCNDIVTTADGTAYAADTVGARIIRVKPGTTTAEEWAKDPALAGVDGLSIGPDGMLYVNSVTANKLFRIDIGADGAAGAITEIATSEPLKGPDGMRFGADGKLYVAENANARVVALTIDGDKATVAAIPGVAYDSPTAVTMAGDTLYVLEAKIGKLGAAEDPGAFNIHPVAMK